MHNTKYSTWYLKLFCKKCEQVILRGALQIHDLDDLYWQLSMSINVEYNKKMIN